VTDTPDHPPGDRGLASLHLPAGETGSHLAHWPPPQRGREVKSVHVKHHAPEPAEQVKPHGWSLTRSHFKEDDDG
jgi:hypothetical protein